MSFLRLGTACAAFDTQGRVLLSRRGDLDVWNLPTGRLDVHEALTDAAAREAHEETGVQVEIERAVGLYYFQATQRMNVLYAGRPAGGALADKTDESTDNRYFPPTALPDSLFADYMVTDAARAGDPPTLHVHTTPPLEMLKLRLKLAQRWVSNLLSGRPEPRHVRFDVLAMCLVWDAEQQRPVGVHRVLCDGQVAPWTLLERRVSRPVRWAGVSQNLAENRLEFVFTAAATPDEIAAPPATLDGPAAKYAAHIRKASGHVWHITDTAT